MPQNKYHRRRNHPSGFEKKYTPLPSGEKKGSKSFESLSKLIRSGLVHLPFILVDCQTSHILFILYPVDTAQSIILPSGLKVSFTSAFLVDTRLGINNSALSAKVICWALPCRAAVKKSVAGSNDYFKFEGWAHVNKYMRL